MRKPTITREGIMEATILLTTEIGLENITTKKVAITMGISEGSIFYHFSSKKELLTQSFYFIDAQIDIALKQASVAGLNLMKNIKKLWRAYFFFFIDHPGYANFYRNFRHSAYYTKEVATRQGNSFPFFAKFVRNYSALLGLNFQIFFIFVIENTLTFAARVSNGDIERTEENIDRIFRMITYGMYGVIKKYREYDFDVEPK